MLIFLSINGIELKYTQEELYGIILNIANGEKGSDDLLKWVITHKE